MLYPTFGAKSVGIVFGYNKQYKGKELYVTSSPQLLRPPPASLVCLFYLPWNRFQEIYASEMNILFKLFSISGVPGWAGVPHCEQLVPQSQDIRFPPRPQGYTGHKRQ